MLENGNGGLTMESIVEKLAEIEKTAESIVEHAQARKTEVEREIQAKRDDFDRELDAYTKAELEKIRTQAEAQMDQVLEDEKDHRGVAYGKCDDIQRDHRKDPGDAGKAPKRRGL